MRRTPRSPRSTMQNRRSNNPFASGKARSSRMTYSDPRYRQQSNFGSAPGTGHRFATICVLVALVAYGAYSFATSPVPSTNLTDFAAHNKQTPTVHNNDTTNTSAPVNSTTAMVDARDNTTVTAGQSTTNETSGNSSHALRGTGVDSNSTHTKNQTHHDPATDAVVQSRNATDAASLDLKSETDSHSNITYSFAHNITTSSNDTTEHSHLSDKHNNSTTTGTVVLDGNNTSTHQGRNTSHPSLQLADDNNNSTGSTTTTKTRNGTSVNSTLEDAT